VSLAWVCTALTGEESLELREWQTPALLPGGIRIRVRAASVNYPDVLMIRGLYQARPDPPFVAGTECAGVVTEVGDGVAGFAPGDRVMTVGMGTFATEVVAVPPAQQVHRVPDEMPFAEAAAFNVTFGTAYHGLLRRGGLKAGESVLVLGASGGCGSAAVQVAKAAGATVIAVAGGPAKCALARKLGADVVLDHRDLPSLSAAVRRHTGGRGVDLVFDPVGGAEIKEPLRSLAWNGRYLVIGFAEGTVPVVKLNQAILKGISIVGVAYGMSALLDPAANQEDFRQLFTWYREGLLAPALGHRFAFGDAVAALRVVWERGALGKVVIEVPG
jgi:NADPH:quinone reductase